MRRATSGSAAASRRRRSPRVAGADRRLLKPRRPPAAVVETPAVAATPQPADVEDAAAGPQRPPRRKPGQTDAASPGNLSRPLAVAVDDAANEVFVADDGHSRVAVFDAGTGAYKRAWTANGDAFKTISCVKIAKDGMVYVCDRQNDRIQVFQKDGKFVKEAYVSKETKGDGSVWDVAFSPDQKLLYVADGHDKKVWILDRASLNTIGSFGDGGRYPGHFYGVGSVAVDSKGNVYTGETYEGKRVQKFVKR